MEVMDSDTYPPSPMMLRYSIARDKSRRNIRSPQRYGETDLIGYTLNVLKGIKSSEKPSTKAISSVDFITGYVSTLFRNYC